MKKYALSLAIISLSLVSWDNDNRNDPSNRDTRQDYRSTQATDDSDFKESRWEKDPNSSTWGSDIRRDRPSDYGDRRDYRAERDYEPTNTGRNLRDRDDRTLTSFDQSENDEDRALVQKIRRAIMEERNLSANAKNIKIIVRDRTVTLRGPVKNAEEKRAIVNKVRSHSEVNDVNDQLEISKADSKSNE